MEQEIIKQLSFAELAIKFTKIGNDYHVLLTGGDIPHIGCTVLALPRPSLTGDGSVSSTASVLNVTGHKDEVLCRQLAERLAAAGNTAVVCSGGFHVDGITGQQIKEVQQAVDEICRLLCEALQKEEI